MNQRPKTNGIAPRTEPSGDERYRAFIENSTEGIWRLEFDPPIDTSLPIEAQVDRAYQHGRLAECNTAMARMYGLSRPDELVGKTLDFMLPSSDESARQYLATIIAAGYKVSELESTERDATGGVRHFANTMIGVVVDGHLQRMWGTQRDISDRKRAELALRESEERLRKAAAAEGYLAAIVSSADEAIVSKNLDGIIQWCNAAAERLFEYEAAELIGRPVRMLIPPERQTEEDDILARLRRGERVEHFETIRLTKSGRRIEVALTVSPVRDASGAIIGASKIARDIGTQKQASSAQAFLAAIVESSDDAIIAKDLDGIIQSCNTAAERVFGYAADELIGRPVRLLIPQDRQDEEDDILAAIRRGQRVDHFETVRRRRDGRLIDVSLTVSPVRDATGRTIGVSKIARDITAQKRAAAELAAQQAWFQVTLASIGDAVIASDPQGHVTFMNATAERLTGWTAAESEGHALTDVFPIINEQTREPVDNPVTLVMRTGGVIGLANHTVLIARDGTEWPIADSAAPIRGTDGATLGVVLVFRDVTEERRSEEAVAEQREWLATTLESIGDAVIATDVFGRIAFMNRVAEELTGWAAAAAHGRPCLDVLSVVDEGSGEAAVDPVGRVLAHGGVIALTSHALLRSADGSERPIDETGAPIRNREGRLIGVVLVFRDVSERRRVELERQSASAERERLLLAERAARAEAERASRVKDEFLAMVSHELRTPLNAILGWTQLMMRSRHDDATLERGLDIVARNTRLQAQLISDLLDISRIVSGKLQLEMSSVDLRTLVDESVDTLRQDAAAKRIEIDRQLDEDAGHVFGDAARLQQVLWNLLSNAIKFTPESGRIAVRLRRSGAHTAIAVTDNGTGIRAEVLPHIFDRFHQADRSITRRFGGLGLGLSIVKHLVDLHGGSVRAESPGEGRGATFTITLPVTVARLATPAGAAVVTAADGPVTQSLLDSLHVLLVEDEPDTRDFLRRLLEAHGAVVRGAGSADEALAAFSAARPDVLVSDIGLPDVDGYQLLARIRALDTPGARTVPAVALTAYARDEDRRRALGAGFQAHIAKPVEATELVAAIAGLAGSLPASRKLT